MNIKKILLYTSMGLFTLNLLSACMPPMQFGMQQDQFERLSKDQQDQVISAYNQRQQTQANDALYNNAINSAAGLIALNQTAKNTNTSFPSPAISPITPTVPTPPTFPAPPVIPPFPTNS